MEQINKVKVGTIERYSIKHKELLEAMGLKDYEIKFLMNKDNERTLEIEVQKQNI